MNIVMISGHGCIRAHKMGLTLLERGHDVHFIAQKSANFAEQYKSFSLAQDVEQVMTAIRMYARSGEIDLFHCHNEPSWYVTAVKEQTDSIPCILDVHDSYIARTTAEQALAKRDAGEPVVRETVEERNNFQLADALVWPGAAFRDVVTKEYGLDQPSIIIPSAVPKRHYQYSGKDWMGGLVYEGKVNLPDEAKGPGHFWSYCDYTEVSKEAGRLGMDFHIYSSRSGAQYRDHYDGFEHVFIHPPHSFEKLLPAIARHDWGLVGNAYPTPEWDVAFPNKLFEYLAAGVPIVAMNAGACGEFVRQHGVGIEVESLDELAKRWSEHRRCRANVLKKRQQFSMNAYIELLEGFYEDVMPPRGGFVAFRTMTPLKEGAA